MGLLKEIIYSIILNEGNVRIFSEMKKNKKKYQLLIPIFLIFILIFLAFQFYEIKLQGGNKKANFIVAENNQLILEGAVLTQVDDSYKEITVKDSIGKKTTVKYNDDTKVEVLFVQTENDRHGNEKNTYYATGKNDVKVTEMEANSKLDIICDNKYQVEKITYYKTLAK